VNGQIAIVTGAARGIGRAIALAFARDGARLTLVDRLGDALENTADEVRALGAPVHTEVADVADVTSVRACVEHTVRHYGGLDVLVNNAGYGVVKPSLEQTEEEWDGVVDSCLKSTFFFSQAAARVMIAAGHGVIVNVSSICGLGGWPRRVPYSAAKAGIVRITEGLGAEWALDGLRVVGVAPGHVLTERLLELEGEGTIDLANMRRHTPRGRLAEIDDIVGVVSFLVSDAARHVNAVVLPVDGGYASYQAPEPIAFELRRASDVESVPGRTRVGP
jgi:NAD(P)-dependent dehydrogenase (short-subunit alcohol dehydrogenase family)